MKKKSGGNSCKVSIIVPVYNAEVFVGRCIESILGQQYSNFELILIDDGSSDRSLEICRNYNDSRILIITHDSNKGVSEARNTGIKAARGKWLAFVDADDMVSSDWLSGFINYKGDADLITHPVVLKENGKESYTMYHDATGKSVEQNIFELYKSHLLGFIWSMFFNRNFILEHNLLFDNRLRAVEDLEFMSRFAANTTSIVSFNLGYYQYTFPLAGKKYGKFNNVYNRIYTNMRNIFQTPKIREQFIEDIVHNMIGYILQAYLWHKIDIANNCIDYYRKEMGTPYILKSTRKLSVVCNLLIKINARCLLQYVAKKHVTKANALGFEYIQFDNI